MRKQQKFDVYCIPVMIWLVIIPMIVKVKFFANPLTNVSWFTSDETMADFFLYYKSMFVTIVGVLMLALLCWQISQMRRKNVLLNADTKPFIPLVIYLVLAVASSLFSQYRYFSVHGMPDQFETIWNLIAYVVAAFYCYYIIEYHQSEKTIMFSVYIGAGLVGLVCFFQFFKMDIYRLIYSSDGYEFTFPEGSVYGPFYNINYVGSYVLLLLPLFILTVLFWNDWKLKSVAAALTVILLVSMYGAQSSTAWIALAGVIGFAVLFLLLKNVKEHRLLWIPTIAIILAGVGAVVVVMPKLSAYIQASDTERRDLENIYTHDDNVEIDYKGQKLFISMTVEDPSFNFSVTDQNQQQISCDMAYTEDDYVYYTLADDRFAGITLMPSVVSKDPTIYGFVVHIDDKDWWFTNGMTDDNSYYYFTDWGKVTKLTEDTPYADFAPLVNKSSLANGRGYIWNKTILLLKDYIVLGAGADCYALVFPNADIVDKYNNGYDNRYITKPHNMYLQIAVQTGVLSLICFLVFYVWYFISSLRIYFKQRLNRPLTITGFAILLGTLGYMIAGIANDSTITVAPVFWALIGIGIGINHRIRTAMGAQK